MKFFRKNKKIFASLIFISILTIGLANFVHIVVGAGNESRKNIAPNTAEAGTKESVDKAYLSSYLASRFLAFASYLIDFSIVLNKKILDLPAIKIGWEIVLSFANLGFVLAIIVIAFATILRIQSYEMKTILWKLIVAALLVNFSLVIAGAILSVSDVLTSIFVKALGKDALSNALANAMNPQLLTEIKNPSMWQTIVDVWGKGVINTLIEMIVGLIFIIFFTFLMTLSILAVAIMLLIRVFHLVMLIIISPIVWLFWIFPNTEKYWKDWWSQFLRWAFFAPLMMFFIYLTVATAACIDPNQQGCVMTSQEQSSSNIAGAISDMKKDGSAIKALEDKGFFQRQLEWFANLILLLGILIGGLFISNKMGAAGAGWAYNTVSTAGAGVLKYSKRKGIQAGTSLFRHKFGKEGEEKSLADRASKGALSTSQRLYQSKIAKYTGLAYLGSHALGLGAHGVAKISAKGEDLVAEANKNIKGKNLNEQMAMLSYADTPTKTAIISNLQKNDLLGKIPNGMDYINKKVKGDFMNYNQGKAYDEVQKSLGINVEAKEAFNNGKMDEFFKEQKKFFQKFSDKDRKKVNYDDIYSDKPTRGASRELHTALQDAVAYGIVANNPSDVKNIYIHTKPINFKSAESAVYTAISRLEREVPGTKAREINEKILDDRIKKGLTEFPEAEAEKKEETKEEPKKEAKK